MITIGKLKIYIKHLGDSDGFAIHGSDFERKNILREDWILIDSLIQDIYLLHKGLLSKSAESKLTMLLTSNVEDAEVVILLKDIAKNGF